MVVTTAARHVLAEYRGCPADRLDDLDAVERLMRAVAQAAGATVIDARFHRFAPHGVSGVLLLLESHLSIHTWPEAGYVTLDVYVCNYTENNRPKAQKLFDDLQAAFNPADPHLHRVDRA